MRVYSTYNDYMSYIMEGYRKLSDIYSRDSVLEQSYLDNVFRLADIYESNCLFYLDELYKRRFWSRFHYKEYKRFKELVIIILYNLRTWSETVIKTVEENNKERVLSKKDEQVIAGFKKYSTING